jgi:hypothetical protein
MTATMTRSLFRPREQTSGGTPSLAWTRLLAVAGLVGVATSAPVWAQGGPQYTVAPGFQAQGLFNPAGSTRQLSNGELIVWNGQTVERQSSSGALLTTLADFSPQFFFTGALAIAPSEQFALVGESSNGDLYRVDLVNGGATLLNNLFFNFDATFEAPDKALVSASTGSLGTGSEVWRIDTSSGDLTGLVQLPGASGPVAVDALGNLIVATASNQFPAPLGSSSVYLFLAAQLTGAPVLSAAQGFVLGSGFDGASSMTIDAASGQIYLAENNFGAGTNRIRQVSGNQAQSPILIEGPSFGWLGVQGIVAGSQGALLAPYQPAFGGRVLVTSTDFFSYDERLGVEPRRPLLGATGPGASGAGPFTLALTDGPLNGFALLAYGPSLAVGPELPIFGLGQPLFTGLSLASASLLPATFVLNGAGAFSQGFVNSGALTGVLTAQALCFDSQLSAVGSSTLLAF